MNYYNEIDRHAAAWLRELIKAGEIPDGFVDERSIADVKPEDLEQYNQCHFFAGIGGWAYALRLAGWPEDRPVWTGSCPCQPFSVAGKGLGAADHRHLWPEFVRLIGACRPAICFGEQVASKDGRAWLAGVFADLAKLGHSGAAADLCAAGIGAPHIRQRLFWVANPETSERGSLRPGLGRRGPEEAGGSSRHCRVSDSGGGRLGIDGSTSRQGRHADKLRENLGLADNNNTGSQGHSGYERNGAEPGRLESEPVRSHWYPSNLIPCRDGKQRRIEPGTQPLVDGIPRGLVCSGDPRVSRYAQNTAEARVMRLRGYGNAIVPQLAAQFIESFEEALLLL